MEKAADSMDALFQQVDNLPPIFREAARAQLNKYQQVFMEEPLGHGRRFPHVIQLTDERPVKQAPRRLSAMSRDVVRVEIEKMLKAGVIRPSRSSWASPVVLVQKKDKTVRFCIDYRALNEKTVADAFPLPHTKDVLNSMAG
jgi:hypothetical protein